MLRLLLACHLKDCLSLQNCSLVPSSFIVGNLAWALTVACGSIPPGLLPCSSVVEASVVAVDLGMAIAIIVAEELAINIHLGSSQFTSPSRGKVIIVVLSCYFHCFVDCMGEIRCCCIMVFVIHFLSFVGLVA